MEALSVLVAAEQRFENFRTTYHPLCGSKQGGLALYKSKQALTEYGSLGAHGSAEQRLDAVSDPHVVTLRLDDLPKRGADVLQLAPHMQRLQVGEKGRDRIDDTMQGNTENRGGGL